jgi:DNA-binding CsgD family transcriptional regulator
MNCAYCGSYLGPVTPKERRCADLLLEGLQGKEIGKRMGISVRTVKQHMRKLFLKYGITDGVKHVKLAVALYYERHPDKRIPTDYKLSNTERFILLNGGGECTSLGR